MALPSVPKNPSSSSLATRAIEPLVTSLWILFLIWSVLVAIIWFADIGEFELRRWFGGIQSTGAQEQIRNPGLFAALRLLLSISDTIWIVIAAVNIYIAQSAREGLMTARRWALAILGAAWLISAASVWTGWPLGPVYFTDRIGMKLGPVPLGWMLLVYCLIAGARDLARTLASSGSHSTIAWLTAAILSLASLPLAIVGWKARAWLIWYPGTVPAPAIPPLQCAFAFLLLGFLSAWLLREERVARSTATPSGRPAAVFLIFLAFFSVRIGTSLL